MTDFPTLGQQAPNYWRDQLKAYIDQGDSTATAAGVAAGNDASVADKVNNGSATRAALLTFAAKLKVWAANPDNLIFGAITRNSNGAATSAPVSWPDGTVGTYTADTLSTAFPGAVDGYHITYGSPVAMTVTQPTVTRDSTTGAVTNRPALVVT